MTDASDVRDGSLSTPRAVLIELAGEEGLGEFALALARRGWLLALWPTGGAEAQGLEKQADALLDLQLAIERAGGISLAVGEDGLGDRAGIPRRVIDAFGHLDAMVIRRRESWAALAPGLASLDRHARERLKIVFLEDAKDAEGVADHPGAPAEVPAGWLWDERLRAARTMRWAIAEKPTAAMMNEMAQKLA